LAQPAGWGSASRVVNGSVGTDRDTPGRIGGWRLKESGEGIGPPGLVWEGRSRHDVFGRDRSLSKERGVIGMASPEDDAIMARFVGDYLDLLDQRLATIQTHITTGDDLTANIALLSLESSSSMAGANELATVVNLLRGAVERRERRHLPALVQAMSNEAQRFRNSHPARGHA